MNYAIWNLSNRPHRAKRRKRILLLKLTGTRSHQMIRKSICVLKNNYRRSRSAKRRRRTMSGTDDEIANLENANIRLSIKTNDKCRLVCNQQQQVRIHTKTNHKSNGNHTAWWWRALFRWSAIFLFIIQLTKQIEPVEAVDYSTTRNSIRFTIDHHSTYFNDLYTPAYGHHTTNSLTTHTDVDSRTTFDDQHKNSVRESSNNELVNKRNQRTTRASSTISSTSRTSAKQTTEMNNILTGNKQIQSKIDKFDKQPYPAWFQKKSTYRKLYTNNIDFEFAHHLTAKRRNASTPGANGETNKVFNLEAQQSERRPKSNNSLDTSVNSVQSSNDFDEFRTTTKSFIPFSSVKIIDQFDYSFSSYDKLVNQIQNSTHQLTTTTKLPRIKKNLKDEQQTTPVQYVDLINRTLNINEQAAADQKHRILLNQDKQTKAVNMTARTGDKINKYIYNDIDGLNDNSTEYDDLPNRNETTEIDTRFLIWLGQYIAHPSFEKLIVTIAQVICLIFTIVGNVFVIISIFTYNPLRNVQNMFLVSLAVSDITVAICILPLNIGYYLIGK